MLASASGLLAQQTATMTLTSAGNNVMDGVYVDPYYATVNGVQTWVICDDYADDSYLNESWTANIYNYSNLGNTRNTTKWNLTATQQTQDYDEAAYLTAGLLKAFESNNTIAVGEITFALWGVFDSAAITSLTAWNSSYGAAAQNYLTQAKKQTYTTGEFSNVLVYSPNMSDPITCSGGPCPTKPPQEFLVVQTPEAPALVVLAFDLLALVTVAFLLRRRILRDKPVASRAKR